MNYSKLDFIHPLNHNDKMKNILISFYLSALFVGAFIFFPHGAQASDRYWICWIFPCYENVTRPYSEDAKTPHNIQWKDDAWRPEDWTATRGNRAQVIAGLYEGGIVHEWDDNNGKGVPTLEVGKNFFRLSDRDKIRVVKYFDYAYGVTASPRATILIETRKGDEVGVYTAQGLQLQ